MAYEQGTFFCALHWESQILQICKRNVILQIIPCQVCVNDSVSFGNGLFVPYNFSRLPASLRESNPQQVRETLTEIRDTANQISTRMYRALEQNRAPKAKEQER